MIEQFGRLVPDVVLQRYLLGDLNGVLRGVVERLYFWSDNLHKRLEIVEAELVDDYVYGRLSARQRLLFENAYVTSARRRDDVAIAQALRDYPVDVEPRSVAPLVPERSAWWRSRWSVVLTGLCLVAVGVWVFPVWRQPAIFTIVLSPEISSSRSPTEAKDPFSVPHGARQVMFEIHPREPHRQRYSAVLKIGRTIVEATGETKASESGALGLSVPLTKLKTGTYSVELTAMDSPANANPVEEYRFELLIRP